MSVCKERRKERQALTGSLMHKVRFDGEELLLEAVLAGRMEVKLLQCPRRAAKSERAIDWCFEGGAAVVQLR